jgi:hypothetical protein
VTEVPRTVVQAPRAESLLRLREGLLGIPLDVLGVVRMPRDVVTLSVGQLLPLLLPRLVPDPRIVVPTHFVPPRSEEAQAVSRSHGNSIAGPPRIEDLRNSCRSLKWHYFGTGQERNECK